MHMFMILSWSFRLLEHAGCLTSLQHCLVHRVSPVGDLTLSFGGLILYICLAYFCVLLVISLLGILQITSKLILDLDYVLILVVEGSTEEYKKEGEGPMENMLSTLSIWHFRVCVKRQLLIIIESLG